MVDLYSILVVITKDAIQAGKDWLSQQDPSEQLSGKLQMHFSFSRTVESPLLEEAGMRTTD